MQLLSNIENCQLKTLSRAQAIQQVLQNSPTPPPIPNTQNEKISQEVSIPLPLDCQIIHIFMGLENFLE